MEDVIKVLKQIVSSFSAFGSIPKPVTVCIAVFSGVFGFGLIFVYANLDKTQKILLGAAIAVMLVVTGAYYLWNSWARKRDAGADLPSFSSPSPSAPSRSTISGSPSSENFWDAPVRARPEPAPRRVQPVAEAARPSAQAVTLLELTEPLFQYVCRLNRIGRRGRSGENTTFLAKPPAGPAGRAGAAGGPGLDEVVVRSEIKALLEDLTSKASVDLRLSHQVEKIELPLIFFIDSLISESALPFAAQWNQNRLAYDRQELAGDEKFFDVLDATLKESGEEAAERLAVFYTCIGLGFTGIYFKQP